MKSSCQLRSAALAAIFLVAVLAGCGDPGETPETGQFNDPGTASLLRTLEVNYGGEPLVQFDGSVDRYIVDVNLLVTAVTLRAVAADSGTAIRASVDGLALPLFEDEGKVQLTGNPTTLEVAAVSGDRVERYAIEIHRGEQPLGESYIKAPTPEAGSGFGGAVALDRGTLAVGAPSGADAAVFVYSENDGEWLSTAVLRADDTAQGESFGASVAIEGDTIVVGAPGESTSGVASGAVYVFVRFGSVWTQQAMIKALSPEIRGEFGASIDISGETIVVGSPGEDGVTGGAYAFSRVGSQWLFQGKLEPDALLRSGDAFGHAVAIDGDLIVVTAPGDDVEDRLGNRFADSGSAHVFTRVGQVWSHHERLAGYYDGVFVQSPRSGGGFGSSVDIMDDSVVVGASGEGRVYIIERGDGSLRSRTVSMSSPGSDDEDGFGASVSADRGFLVVGADGDDRGDPGLYGLDALDSGAVFLYSKVHGEWALAGRLKASNLDASDRFFDAALDGDTLAVGAVGEDGNGADPDDDSATNSGAVYVFR